MKAPSTRRRVQPITLADLRHGFDTVARLMALTLGPTGGMVLGQVGKATAEALADSATISRRITGLPGRARTGAAIACQLVRRVGQRHGDGGATALVLAQGMLRHAVKMVAAGASPTLVRRGLERGARVAHTALAEQAIPVDGEATLSGLAGAATGDRELASVLGEMLSLLGADGAVQLERHEPVTLGHEYLNGARWRARPADRQLLAGGHTELTLTDPAILVTDIMLDQTELLRPLLEAAMTLPDHPPMLVVAPGLSDGALTLLHLNEIHGRLVSAPVVLATPLVEHQDDLADLALLTGATLCSAELGLPPSAFRAEHVGRARRVLVQRGYLTVIGAAGDREKITDAAARLRARVLGLEDSVARQRLWLRQARLSGKVGTVRIGGHTRFEQDTRMAQAERAIELLGSAARDGMVPGGGIAYLNCIPAVRAARTACPERDVVAGFDAVAAGLEAPFLQLVHNGRLLEPRSALHRVRQLGATHGVDILTGRYVDMHAAGIMDAFTVTAQALAAAAETTGLLISAEVVGGRG